MDDQTLVFSICPEKRDVFMGKQNTKDVFFWYIFLPLLFFADIENVFFWACLGKMAGFEGFRTFCLKSWKVSQTTQRFQIL